MEAIVEVEHIVQKRGEDWTSAEVDMVFQWIMQEELDGLIRFAYGFTQTLATAEDAVQEGLTSAFQYLSSYNPEKYQGNTKKGKCDPEKDKCDPKKDKDKCVPSIKCFQNWCYCIIARKSTSLMKKQALELPWEEELDQQLGLSYSIEDLETAAEVQSEIERYVNQLSPKHQEVLTFSFRGNSHAEAAELSKWPCTAKAMKVRKHRAIQELQQVLVKEGVL